MILLRIVAGAFLWCWQISRYAANEFHQNTKSKIIFIFMLVEYVIV